MAKDKKITLYYLTFTSMNITLYINAYIYIYMNLHSMKKNTEIKIIV